MITSEDFKELIDVVEYFKAVPYDITRKQLYNAADLYQGYCPSRPGSWSDCYDNKVYQHYMSTGKTTQSVKESLARTIHDHSIHTALNEFLANRHLRHFIGIMGGHAQLRSDTTYRDVALLSKRLTEQGFHMLSGGGPGAMEATHLGAWMAGREDSHLDEAIGLLAASPSFKDDGWLSSAFQVMEQFPQTGGHVSLGIPTWLYGHEPSTPFATHIAKFFENSIREDSILTLAYGGIIYTPGSAGTMQEVFQDAVQNHYLSFGFSSPMIFMGKRFWTEEMPVYPLLKELSESGKYHNLILTLTDDPDEVVHELLRFRDE